MPVFHLSHVIVSIYFALKFCELLSIIIEAGKLFVISFANRMQLTFQSVEFIFTYSIGKYLFLAFSTTCSFFNRIPLL